MKALMRNEGETVTEKDGVAGIDWKTGAPLTNEQWCGGPYTLVQDYIEPEDDGSVTETFADTEEYVVVDGVKMTREEALKKLSS